MIEQKSQVDFLREVRLFRHLSQSALEEIIFRSKVVRLKKGVVLCKKNAPAHSFYAIISGNVTEIVTDSNDFSISLKMEGKYDYYGELGILLDEGYSSTVICITNVEVVCIHKEVFSELVWGNQQMLKLILQSLKERLQTAGQKEIAFTQMNAESRLAYVLLTIYNSSATKAPISTTQEQLALNCGIARQTASTILNRWSRQGILSLQRQKIIIYEPSTLEDIFLLDTHQ